MKQAVLSLSGGMDSSTVLLHLLAKGYEVTALSFDYGQNHLIEILLPIQESSNGSILGLIDGYEFVGFRGLASHGAAIGIAIGLILFQRKYKLDELTPEQKKKVNTQNFRRFIVFCAFFAATRDILAAVTLTIIFVLFVSEAFTDTEDMKNKKKKKITTTDIQNELNGLINKVKMMELDKGENEINK